VQFAFTLDYADRHGRTASMTLAFRDKAAAEAFRAALLARIEAAQSLSPSSPTSEQLTLEHDRYLMVSRSEV